MWFSGIVMKLVPKEGAFRPFIGVQGEIPVTPGNLHIVKWPNGTEEKYLIERDEEEDSPNFWRVYFTVYLFGAPIRIFLGDGHDIMLSDIQES